MKKINYLDLNDDPRTILFNGKMITNEEYEDYIFQKRRFRKLKCVVKDTIN